MRNPIKSLEHFLIMTESTNIFYLPMMLNYSSELPFLTIYLTATSFFNLTLLLLWLSKHLDLSLNYSICHVMSFFRSRYPISHFSHTSHMLSTSPQLIMLPLLNTWTFFTLLLSPLIRYIYNIVGRVLKILGFIMHNTTNFSSTSSFRAFYFSLFRSILEYEVMVWHPRLPCDELRTERVQNRLLSYVTFLLTKINNSRHDYSSIP